MEKKRLQDVTDYKVMSFKEACDYLNWKLPMSPFGDIVGNCGCGCELKFRREHHLTQMILKLKKTQTDATGSGLLNSMDSIMVESLQTKRRSKKIVSFQKPHSFKSR